ncbi:MAG: hypothetical protein ACREWE_16375, partial [Gammaproteobacteria bacterium]
SLRLGRASKVQEKSLKRHIAWLDKRIEEIETDLRQRLRASPALATSISRVTRPRTGRSGWTDRLSL